MDHKLVRLATAVGAAWWLARFGNFAFRASQSQDGRAVMDNCGR